MFSSVQLTRAKTWYVLFVYFELSAYFPTVTIPKFIFHPSIPKNVLANYQSFLRE